VKIARVAILPLVVMFVVPAGLRSQTPPDTPGQALEAMPKDLEARLALSALPPYLRPDATVFVLDPAKGYIEDRHGSNNFTCFVERTDWVREDYRNDLFIPECFDAEGTKTIVPVSFDVAQLRAQGKLDPHQLKQEIAKRFKEGAYHSPARPGISYMLSPVQRLYGGSNSRTVHFVNMPHYMFYAPNLTSEDVGGGPIMGQYPYLVNPGPHAYVIVNAGETEKAQINHNEQALWQDLCKYRQYFCQVQDSTKNQDH